MLGRAGFPRESNCIRILVAGLPRGGMPKAAARRLDAGLFCEWDVLGEFRMRVAGLFAAVSSIL